MNSFAHRLLLHIRYLAIRPVLILNGALLFIYISVQILPAISNALVCNMSVFDGQIWRLLSGVFLHQDFGHLFFNSLLILFLGRWFYECLGMKLTIIIILSAGIAANLIHISIYTSPILGISGALFALLTAASAKEPHTRMWFFPAWIFTAILVFLQFLGFLNTFNENNHDLTAYDAHLFGALIGYGCIYLQYPLRNIHEKIKDKRAVHEEINYSQDLQRFDQLLQRISEQGLHTLTDQERVFLKKHSEHERQRKGHK